MNCLLRWFGEAPVRARVCCSSRLLESGAAIGGARRRAMLSPDHAGWTIYLILHRRALPSRAATHPLAYFSRAHGHADRNRRREVASRRMTQASLQRAAVRRAGELASAPKRSARSCRSTRSAGICAAGAGSKLHATPQREPHATAPCRPTTPTRGDNRRYRSDWYRIEEPHPRRAPLGHWRNRSSSSRASPARARRGPRDSDQEGPLPPRAAPSPRWVYSLEMQYC